VKRKAIWIVLGIALAALAGFVVRRSSPVIEIAPGEDVQQIVDSAPTGATVRLLAGRHSGPVTVSQRIELEGEAGAVLVAGVADESALQVRADGTRVSGLEVVGGWTGIELDDAEGAVVGDVSIRGSDLQGMLVYKASATVENVRISGLRDPHAQGIEVLSAPDVIVRDSKVTGGKIGIVGHLSEVLFENNVVTQTSQIGIMIREMSNGAAHGNEVFDAEGAGLYCGDMSMCEFADNTVHDIAATGTARSGAGWGLVVHYESTASSTNDVLEGEAGDAVALANSRMADRSPLELGAGTAAIRPALSSTALSLVVLALVFAACYRFVRPGGDGPIRQAVSTTGTVLLATGVAVQSFHMLEHVVQLSRVRFDGVPSRGSLVGSVADTEWVHFGYNGLVLAGLVIILILRRNGWNPRGNRLLGDRLILAGAVLQGYHLVEHSFKVVQHEVTGAKVNPGLLGESFDLVLFHFGLNAAIYLAFMAAAVAYSWRPRMWVALRRRDPATGTEGPRGVGPAAAG
jgi:hypothetical protein